MPRYYIEGHADGRDHGDTFGEFEGADEYTAQGAFVLQVLDDEGDEIEEGREAFDYVGDTIFIDSCEAIGPTDWERSEAIEAARKLEEEGRPWDAATLWDAAFPLSQWRHDMKRQRQPLGLDEWRATAIGELKRWHVEGHFEGREAGEYNGTFWAATATEAEKAFAGFAVAADEYETGDLPAAAMLDHALFVDVVREEAGRGAAPGGPPDAVAVVAGEVVAFAHAVDCEHGLYAGASPSYGDAWQAVLSAVETDPEAPDGFQAWGEWSEANPTLGPKEYFEALQGATGGVDSFDIQPIRLRLPGPYSAAPAMLESLKALLHQCEYMGAPGDHPDIKAAREAVAAAEAGGICGDVLESERGLVLSTAHVSPATGAILDGESLPFTVWRSEFGWNVATAHDRDGLPDDLRAVLGFARARGFDWVRIDCNGPEVEALPRFEWEG